jgi:hypothetical protein
MPTLSSAPALHGPKINESAAILLFVLPSLACLLEYDFTELGNSRGKGQTFGKDSDVIEG